MRRRTAKIDKATGKVTDEVVYMTADVEDEFIVAQANEKLNEDRHLCKTTVFSHVSRASSFRLQPTRVDYMDISPQYGLLRCNGDDPVPRKR